MKVLLLSNILINIIARKYLNSHKGDFLIYISVIHRKFTNISPIYLLTGERNFAEQRHICENGARFMRRNEILVRKNNSIIAVLLKASLLDF